MTQNRVRIVDVADALGLSTATVSNVIHGKTEKISDKTVKRVQQELERSGYIPNMAGILLARNNSRIIEVVVNDHEKYEGRVLEDGFVMSSLNALSHEVNENGDKPVLSLHCDMLPPLKSQILKWGLLAQWLY
ncbi:LacI family DNA-binding transcriptional regulator [Eubacterium ramulus]